MDQAFIKKCLLPIEPVDEIIDSDLDEDKALLNYLLASGKNPNQEFRQAGVLLPLVRNENKDHWNVILTKRALHLKHHPGEISFPGGQFEQQDKNLETTAKRETEEEIGIASRYIQTIGRLPRQNTISLYQVSPFVGIIDPDYQLTIDENEVAEAFLVPLSFVIDSSNHQKVNRNINNQSVSYHLIQYNDYKIWGVTARMLVNLSRMLA
jgi:8-oxo-dGTP pyrophosphatase MutT (NUDIX family)